MQGAGARHRRQLGRRRGGTFLLLASAAVALGMAGAPSSVREWVLEVALDFAGRGTLGLAVFFAAYVLATMLLVPGSLLTLATGFAWGPLWGLAIASPASVAGATGAFLLGRGAFRHWANRKAQGSRRWRAILEAVGRDGFKVVLLLRLSPVVPFNVLNYSLGVTGIPLRQYVGASAVGMFPGTVLNVYVGSVGRAATEAVASGTLGAAQMVLLVAGLLATAAVVVLITRAARRRLEAELTD